MPEPRILYERADLTAEELQAEIEAFFALAPNDSAIRQDAADAGIDLTELLSSGPEQIEVKPDDAGLTGFEEALIVMLLTPVAETAWKDVVLPWLRRRRRRPVGEEQSPEE